MGLSPPSTRHPAGRPRGLFGGVSQLWFAARGSFSTFGLSPTCTHEGVEPALFGSLEPRFRPESCVTDCDRRWFRCRRGRSTLDMHTSERGFVCIFGKRILSARNPVDSHGNRLGSVQIYLIRVLYLILTDIILHINSGAYFKGIPVFHQRMEFFCTTRVKFHSSV